MYKNVQELNDFAKVIKRSECDCACQPRLYFTSTPAWRGNGDDGAEQTEAVHVLSLTLKYVGKGTLSGLGSWH